MLSLLCVKFHNDRLRNDSALENRKSDNNKNDFRSAWRPVSGSNKHCTFVQVLSIDYELNKLYVS